jgi:hypothetical protein
MIEGAIVALPFFVLIFGILDFGLYFKSYLGVSAATASAARVASTQANALSADYHILTAVDRAAAALDRDDIERIVIFRATSADDDAPAAGCLSGGGGVAGECNVYFPAAFDLVESEFDCSDPTGTATDTFWCPTSRHAYFDNNDGTSNPDFIGVYIEYSHQFLTGMFGDTRDFDATTVLRIEPQGLEEPG